MPQGVNYKITKTYSTLLIKCLKDRDNYRQIAKIFE